MKIADPPLKEKSMSQSIRFEDLPNDALVRLPLALAVTGWKKTRFYALMKAGIIPAAVALGERAVGWRVGELRQAELSGDVSTGTW